MKLSRRDFLKAGAATGTALALGEATFGLGGLGPGQVSQQPASLIGIDEKLIPSVCLQCPAGCGIVRRVVNGRLVKIEGNPLHPINEGRLCPKGQIGVQILYDPDRIRGPLKRAGSRGDNSWEEISLNEAIRIVASHLSELRASRSPHKLVFLSGRNRGQAGDIIGRFLEAFGSPNNVGHSSICADGSPIAHWATQGWKAYAGYDWDNTNYLISFGGAFLEAWRPTTRLLRAFGHMHRGRPIRGKIVMVDTRLSVTAIKADEWIPIRPATDGALALGIAHEIISAELYDKHFVSNYTFGFEDWTDEAGKQHKGWKRLVLERYAPEKVEQITGTEAATIKRIAREFAKTHPAVAAGERGSSMQTNGVYNRMAIHALNALVGSIDVPGGVIMQRGPPLKAWPPIIKDDIASAGLSQPRMDYAGTRKYPLAGKVYQDVPDRILESDPYDVDAVLIYYTNPLFSTPNAARYRKAFEKVPFIVSFSPFMDESTQMADVVIPDHTYLERWHDDIIYPSLGYPVVAMRQPVVQPLYNTHNALDSILLIAKAIGGSVAESFPWPSFEDALKFRYSGIFEAQTGTIVKDTFDEFWNEFAARGVWAAPPYQFGEYEKVLVTPSSKFEFYSLNIEHKLEAIAQKEAEKHGTSPEEEFEKMLVELGIEAREDEVFMPHYEPPRFRGDKARYPLHLITYKLMIHAEGRGANVPLLREMIMPHSGSNNWESWLEINPDTARTLGISNNQEVWIESSIRDPEGRVRRIKARAILFEGSQPDVVSMPFELGHSAYGRWAENSGSNPNLILANENDRLGGLAGFSATRVRVYPVEGPS